MTTDVSTEAAARRQADIERFRQATIERFSQVGYYVTISGTGLVQFSPGQALDLLRRLERDAVGDAPGRACTEGAGPAGAHLDG